jgi:hypothetical protein
VADHADGVRAALPEGRGDACECVVVLEERAQGLRLLVDLGEEDCARRVWHCE